MELTDDQRQGIARLSAKFRARANEHIKAALANLLMAHDEEVASLKVKADAQTIVDSVCDSADDQAVEIALKLSDFLTSNANTL
jgi:hypothetical protein